MQSDLIDAKFNSLFKEIKKLDKQEGRELVSVLVIAAGLGYWAFMSISGACLSVFFAWQIRGGTYSTRRDILRDRLGDLSLTFPDEAKKAAERFQYDKMIAKASKGWFK
ncbi:hypothetical protein A9Q94_10245 [Rhodobacterales bacterium 56_14_T64]|nr:hypothetical protein A9Q94_10245 [Rhodobacterales bacterium 56_14_T64]